MQNEVDQGQLFAESPSEIDKLITQLDRLQSMVTPILTIPAPPTTPATNTNTNAQVVRVQAGEVGTWIAIIILAIACGCGYLSVHSDVQRAQDYLNNIYQVAPHCVHDDQKGKIQCPQS